MFIICSQYCYVVNTCLRCHIRFLVSEKTQATMPVTKHHQKIQIQNIQSEQSFFSGLSINMVLQSCSSAKSWSEPPASGKVICC